MHILRVSERTLWCIAVLLSIFSQALLAQQPDKLALKAMEATPEEKELAKQTIDELREDLRLARIEIVALKKSRDQFQNENNQLKKQVAMLTKKLKGYEQ